MILIWRFAYNVWLVGIMVLWLIALSNLIFGRGKLTRRLNKYSKALALSFVWPLALLTPQGRALLMLNTKEAATFQETK